MAERKKPAPASKTDDAAEVTEAPADDVAAAPAPVVAEPAPVAEPARESVPEPVAAPEPVTVSAVPPPPPVDAETGTPQAVPQEIIVVDAPTVPRKRGNRGLGVTLALVATLVFTALLVAAVFAITRRIDVIADPEFYFPSLAFFIGLVIVTLVLNRAGWWSHIIGSVVVGAITWFGSATLALLAAGMLTMNQGEANDTFFAALFSPTLIIAALLAREVSIWTGAILARRGRTLKVRNAEAYEAYEREQAELTPTATV